MFEYGKIKNYKAEKNIVTIDFENMAGCRIEIVTSKIVNVFAPFACAEHRSKAIEGNKVRPTEWSVKKADNALLIKTPALEVRVYDDFKVDFYQDGKLICQDYRATVVRSGEKLSDEKIKTMEMEGHKVAQNGKEHKIEVFKQMDGDECFYGLGEETGFLNKRNFEYEMWNTDNPSPHTDAFNRLYQSIPFFITAKKSATFGLFFDNTFRATFNMGTDNADNYSYGVDKGNLDYYFIAGKNIKEVITNYTYLTGRMNLPQLWALGYHQSRWGYVTEDDFRDIMNGMRNNRIPCDVLHMDIDYMDAYKVFTFHPERHPEPKKFMEKLKNRGFKAVTIIDPGVKIEKGYSVYEEGFKNGYFAKDSFSGNYYINKVWPGKCMYPDFGNPKVRIWWGNNHKAVLDQGVAGIWNDMNEPASFEGELPLDVQFTDEDRVSTHEEMHNVYGHNMSKGTYLGLKKLTGKRPFVITRACYAGSQKYALVWTGDNGSYWAHLQMAIPQLCNLGLSGMAFCGTDIGGFGQRSNPELLTRWIQVGVFCPLCRNHNMDSVSQEPWKFGEPYLSIYRKYVELRYKLIPYFYQCFKDCSKTGIPMFRPLVLNYPEDAEVRQMNDEFMVGDNVLVAPVVNQGQTKRLVYLPKGVWYDYWTKERVKGGKYVMKDAPLDTCPIYVKEGTVLPYFDKQEYIGQIDNDKTLLVEIYGKHAKGTVYQDNGTDFDYQKGKYNEYQVQNQNGTVTWKAIHSGYEKPYQDIQYTIFD